MIVSWPLSFLCTCVSACRPLFFQSAWLDVVSNEKYLPWSHSFRSWPLLSWFKKAPSLCSYFLFSCPLFLTMPFSLSFILLFPFLFLFTSFPTTSLLPLLLPPWMPQSVFGVSLTPLSSFNFDIFVGLFYSCTTVSVPNWPVWWIHWLLRPREVLHAYLIQILFLVESQSSCSAKWLQPCALMELN